MISNDEILALALLLLGRSKGGGSSSSSSSSAAAETKPAAADDGLKLVARADQASAKKWVPLFVQQDVPPGAADALARWAGIESSGNPLIPSKLDERGLLQVGPAMFKDLKADKIFTDADWDKLISPATNSEEHARMAHQFANWLWKRAYRYIKNPPTDYISALWYAKLYHQRPVDVRDGGMHGPAALMARELADRWKSDAKKMHRLRAANVVAWGTPEAPTT